MCVGGGGGERACMRVCACVRACVRVCVRVCICDKMDVSIMFQKCGK